jgi:hypothetical protein
MENGHIWETTLEDLTYQRRVPGLITHALILLVKSLSASMQIHEIYCESSLVDIVMAILKGGSLDREVSLSQLVSMLHWDQDQRNYHRKGRFRWPVDMHCSMTID